MDTRPLLQDAAALAAEFHRRLPPPVERAVDATLTAAAERGLNVYAVGGSLRDLLLGILPLDVDLAVDGDASSLAEAVAARLGAPVRCYPRFLTATVTVDRYAVDLATCRRERYPRPGALPAVEPASIDEDLARRDFAINALALRLSGAPALLDPFDGRGDLARRLIRVLHDRSFQDDPTRICRAIRYAARLGFEPEERTLALLRRDASCLRAVSGSRLLRELELILAEATAAVALETCGRLRVLRPVHPALRMPVRIADALAARPPDLPPLPFGLALLLRDAHRSAIHSALARLHLRGRQAAAVLDVPAARRALEGVAGGGPPSRLAARFEAVAPVALAAVALTAPDGLARDSALRYLRDWRHRRPEMDGRALQALGVSPGPPTGRVLRALRDARLDGRVSDQAGEEALARALIERGIG